MPELPAARRKRLVREYGLREKDARVLTADRALADYFEAVARAGKDARAAANWVLTEVLRKVNEAKIRTGAIPLDAERLGRLIAMVADGTISGRIAKEVFEAIFDSGREPAEVVRESGLTQVTDEGELSSVIEAVIDQSPRQLAQYRAGKTTVIGYFVGQVMKATGGKANPALVNRLLKQRLDRH